MSWRRLQDVVKRSWKTRNCYTDEVFKSSSPRRMFAVPLKVVYFFTKGSTKDVLQCPKNVSVFITLKLSMAVFRPIDLILKEINVFNMFSCKDICMVNFFSPNIGNKYLCKIYWAGKLLLWNIDCQIPACSNLIRFQVQCFLR